MKYNCLICRDTIQHLNSQIGPCNFHLIGSLSIANTKNQLVIH